MPPEITPMGRDMPFDPEKEICQPPFAPEGMCAHFQPFPTMTTTIRGKMSMVWSFGLCSFHGECSDREDCPSVKRESGSMQDLVRMKYDPQIIRREISGKVKRVIILN